MNDLLKELRLAARALGRRPALAAAAIVTLALGIGVSTAIFSVADAVLLRSLPYEKPDQLAIITSDMAARNVNDFPLAPGDVYDIREGATLFDGIAALVSIQDAPLARDGKTPEPITATAATTNIFDVLKVPVVLGRSFQAADGTPQPPPTTPPGGPAAQAPPTPPLPVVGILGYDFWRREYGSDPSIVGKSIDVFGQPMQIVGVASPRAQLFFPPSMQVARDPDLWFALRVNFEGGSRINVSYRLIGRLEPGATIGAARGQLDRIAADFRAKYPIKKTADVRLRAEPVKQYLVASVRPAIVSLMAAVVLVLLIACANVANLLLVRAAERQHEIAVRSALGGSAWTIARQVLAESLVIALVAGVLGVALARLGIVLLVHIAPPNLPRMTDVSIDPLVLGFALAASIAAALLAGLAPALRVARPNISAVLQAGGRNPHLGGATRLRSAIIVAEVALSFVLLVGCGLMIRSFVALTRVDPKFDPVGVLTFQLRAPRRPPAPDADAAFVRQVRDRLAALPGVTAVTATGGLPLDGGQASCRWGTLDAAADPNRFRQANFFVVPGDYFRTMKTPLLAGRTFTRAEEEGDSHVVIIDDAAAKLAFGDANPVGRTILARARSNDPEQLTVVGVVAHQRSTSLSGHEPEALYFPEGQFGARALFTWAVRTSGQPAALATSVRAAVEGIDRNLLITQMQPMTDFVVRAEDATRFELMLLGIFAAIAAVLAAVGLYGVLSNVVRQRTPEIGIRMAIGAEPVRIFQLVLRYGLTLSAVGVGIGLVTALVATQVMTSVLVDVRPTDPLTFVAMVGAFIIVATVACWMPARRAAGLDPNAALREE